MYTSRKNSDKSALYTALLFIGALSLGFMLYMDNNTRRKIITEIDQTEDFIQRNRFMKSQDKQKDLTALASFRNEVNRTLFFQVRERQRQEESIAGTAAMVRYSAQSLERTPSSNQKARYAPNAKAKHSQFNRKKIASNRS